MTNLFDTALRVGSQHPGATNSKPGYLLRRQDLAWEVISQLNLNPADEGLVQRLAGRSISNDPTDEFNIGIYRMTSGMKHPLHAHASSAEFYYVLDGEAHFTVGDHTAVSGTGTAIYIPAGMPHAIKSVEGQEMELLYFFSNPDIAAVGTRWF